MAVTPNDLQTKRNSLANDGMVILRNNLSPPNKVRI